MSFTKQSNRLDDALIAGHITHDQYLAAGGRTPETMLRGLREGSDALVKRHGIREIRSSKDMLSPDFHRQDFLKFLLSDPSTHIENFGPDSTDWKAINDAKRLNTVNPTILEDLYSKLDRSGPVYAQVNSGAEGLINLHKNRVLRQALSLRDTEALGAFSSPGNLIYTPTASTDTLGTRLNDLLGRKRNALDSEFDAELTRRHEIDEYRYNDLGQKSKRTLGSFGHAHPRVILNEHINLARAPKGTRNSSIDMRYRSREIPAYNIASEGRFEYGKGFKDVPIKPGGSYDFNAAKRSIERSIADDFFDNREMSRAARQAALKAAPVNETLSGLLGDLARTSGKSLITRTLSNAPDASLLGRLSNFIIKHSEYAPSNKSHLKIAYEMGAQEALRRAGI